MKKVVIISSSPRRKGNSAILCEQFAKGAVEAGNTAEIINLNDYNIYPCIACEYCRKHNQVCFRKDDADTVIQKMIEADVWVLASPVYFNSMTAQMKLLIDRFYAREYEIRNSKQHREVYYLITAAAPELSDTSGILTSLRGFIQIMRTVDEKGIINGTGTFQLNDVYEHPSYTEAYEMGKHC